MKSTTQTVGTPSRARLEADGMAYVEVPVMITGRFLGGKPFGSTDSVTVRRPSPELRAPQPRRLADLYGLILLGRRKFALPSLML